MALRAYEQDKGALPDTLTQLTPDYLTTLPNDPYALGAALHYQRNGQSFKLYSVGPDGTDDGGQPVPANADTNTASGDILAPLQSFQP